MRVTEESKAAVREFLGDIELAHKHEGFYVYIAVFEDVVYYVGKGSKSRYTHCNSGKSGNADLNRLHFAGVKFDVYVFEDRLEEEAAFAIEAELIKQLKPRFNSVKKCTANVGYSGAKVRGSIDNKCLWCRKPFTWVDKLPGFITTTEETHVCSTCWIMNTDN